MKTKSAIIVPNCSDYNRGDQALVWEAAHLLRNIFKCIDIYIVSSFSVNVANEQNLEFGLNVLPGIIRTPRRFKEGNDYITENIRTLIILALNSIYDFFSSLAVFLFANNTSLCNLFLNKQQHATIEAFRKSDFVVVKGGGFLHTYGKLRSIYYIWYQLYYLYLGYRLGKQIIILPNSYGPFHGPIIIKLLLKHILCKCAFISARESISSETISKILNRQIEVFPDMAYNKRIRNSIDKSVLIKSYSIPIDSKLCVGITLRPYRFPASSNPHYLYEKYIRSFVNFTKHLRSKDFFPVFIAHVLGPNKHEDDRYAIKEVLSRLHGLDYGYIDIPGDHLDLKDIYSHMSYVVGTRFHSIIFSQCCNIPSIAISYGGNKGNGIMSDIGLSEYTIRIEDITSKSLCSKFDSLVENTPIIKKQLNEWLKSAHKRHERMEQIVRDILKDK
ncbi:MAG: polysaccharide pyruvyl transferase family protein [Bacteroidota bacterium]